MGRDPSHGRGVPAGSVRTPQRVARRGRSHGGSSCPDREGVRRDHTRERPYHDDLARRSACLQGDRALSMHGQADARGPKAVRPRFRGASARQLHPTGGSELGAASRPPRPAVREPILQPRYRPRPDHPQRLHAPGSNQAHTPDRPARLPDHHQRAIPATTGLCTRKPHRQLRTDPPRRDPHHRRGSTATRRDISHCNTATSTSPPACFTYAARSTWTPA